MNNPMLEAALHYAENGYSIIPTLPGGQKKPALPWKQYTATPATAETITSWYTAHPEWGIAVICGQVSGNLTMIEIEGRALNKIGQLKQAFTDTNNLDLWDTLNAGWLEQSPTGGLHWFTRTTDPAKGNQKLAATQNREVTAETRGEGGYVIVHPTNGEHHTNGKPWLLLNGGPQTVPTLTNTDLDTVLDLFRTLNETPEPQPTPTPQLPAPVTSTPTPGQRPGDDWAQKTTWDEILQPQGWTKHHTTGTETHWTRPGKNTGDGTSATTRADGNLYVFSTSTPFETEVPLSKLFIYAHYHHNGNLSDAARHLAKQGYGDQLQNITIDLPTTPPRPQLHVINGTQGTSALQPNPQIQVQHSGDLTEASAARYIADAYHQQIRYITNSDRWIHWNGHAWKPTGKNAGPIKQLTIQAIENLPTQTKEEHAYRKRLLNSAGINATLTLTATDPRITIEQNQLDTRHGELNTPGGTINLHTGKLTPPNPNHLHTRTTLTTPQPTPTPMWNKFLTETFHGHPGITNYVQQLAGYSATGYIRSQILPFLHGAGANGKSVLAEVLQQLLNDYAEPAPANFLMQTQQQHPTEIARLQGARLVIASEVPEGARFDEVKVKQLTGGDTLTARYMHGDFFTFQPTHKLWLLGNHQPKVSAGGYSFWRRLRQIPFTNTVPEQNRVEDLAHKLIEKEGAGILQWVIQGAAQYLNHGLTEPAEVLEATQAYEESEDALRRFTDDRLNIGGGDYARITYKDMRNAYAEWCRLEGIKPTTASAFTREMQTRFNIGTTKSNGARHYTNCTLLEDPDEPETDTDSPWADLGGGTKW